MSVIVGLLACAFLLAMVSYNIHQLPTPSKSRFPIDKILGIVGYLIANIFVIFAVYIFLGVKL